MKRSLVIILLILFPILGFGQVKTKKADDHFAKLEYFHAAPIYKELAKKAIKGSGNWENVRKAAFSYKQLFQYNQARYYYSKLHETNRLTESDYVEYIDLLRTIGKYEVAEQLLQDGYKVFPSNNFVALLKDRNKNLSPLMADSSIYSIESLPINSDLGDFCPAFYQKGILFMSKSKNAGFLNTRYGWDNSYFINMLYSGYDLDSSMMKPQLLKDAFFSRAHDGPVSFSADGNFMAITKNTQTRQKGNEVVVLAIYLYRKNG